MGSNSLNEMKSTYRFSDIWYEPLRILPLIEDYEQIKIVSLEESIKPIKDLIPNIDRMIWIVKQNNSLTEDDLTFDESSSIMLYSMEWIPIEKSFYYLFNQILRSDNQNLFKPCEEYIKGKLFIWWAFLSCTISEEYISEFLNKKKSLKTLFKIECVTGKDIHQYTLFPEHQDILFLPARQFEVIDNYQQDNYLYIIHLKEIKPCISFFEYTSSSSIYNILKRKQSNNEYINSKLINIIDYSKSHGEIKLNKFNLIDSDMDIVSKQAINNKNCIDLSLHDNQITSKGLLILISVLYNNMKLNKLVLSKNFIDDLGRKYFSQILSTNHTNIKILDLSNNSITYQGIEYISEMLKTNQILTSLWFNGNEITDQGVEFLMNSLAYYNTTLKYLRLSSDQTITDLSINSIMNMMKNNKTLNYLDIQNSKISLNGKKLIEDAVKSKKHFYLHI